MKSVMLLLALLAVANIASTANVPISSDCQATPYRQFDFWLGDWDVFEYGDTTQAIARAKVERIAEGCAIHELYEQNDGLIGDSILSFDGVRQGWQQTWVTNRGGLMVIAGRFENGIVTLEGETHMRDGRTVLQRIKWQAEGNDVREWAEMSKDGGKTWVPAFDVLFRRRQ